LAQIVVVTSNYGASFLILPSQLFEYHSFFPKLAQHIGNRDDMGMIWQFPFSRNLENMSKTLCIAAHNVNS
jgi:hypothetical protein